MSAATSHLRPVVSADTAFFWEGVQVGEFRVQRCVDCRVLRHPPTPCCSHCGSFASDYIRSSGTGEIYSYVVVHHPITPPFDGPYVVVLVELSEGTRFVAGVREIDAGNACVGLPVEVTFVDVESDLVLPFFRPRR